MSELTFPPPGYRAKADGTLVPEKNIKEVDLVRDDLVTEIHREALDVVREAREFRDRALADVDAFVAASGEKYGKDIGGKSGFTLTSFDGSIRIQVARRDLIRFNEQLKVAQELIADCIDEWSDGIREEIKLLVNDAFRPNKSGDVSIGKILSLKRYKFDHPKWSAAMEAIDDATQVDQSVRYIRVYERKGDQYELLNLHPGGAEGGSHAL